MEQRTSVPVKGAPDGLMIIAPPRTGKGFTQHYFDSRGVVRLYAMTFDGRESSWSAASRTSLRSRSTSASRGRCRRTAARMEGRWLNAHAGGAAWELDFPLAGVRV